MCHGKKPNTKTCQSIICSNTVLALSFGYRISNNSHLYQNQPASVSFNIKKNFQCSPVWKSNATFATLHFCTLEQLARSPSRMLSNSWIMQQVNNTSHIWSLVLICFSFHILSINLNQKGNYPILILHTEKYESGT